MVRSKPRQILHIIGAYTMSCKQGSKRGAYIEPRENHYCALGYARANAQPKARQPTRPKGHFIYVFPSFLHSLLQRSTSRRVRAFLLFGAGIGKYDVSWKRAVRRDFMRCAQPAVRRGQDTRPTFLPGKGLFRQTAGRIYASPTSRPIIFIIIYGRGRGMPRPYRAMFLLPRRAG